MGLWPEARRVIVEEAQNRGKRAPRPTPTHPAARAWPWRAGIDGIHHPDLMGPRERPPALVRAIADKRSSRSTSYRHLFVRVVNRPAQLDRRARPRGRFARVPGETITPNASVKHRWSSTQGISQGPRRSGSQRMGRVGNASGVGSVLIAGMA